jgi:hypothetical protein
MDGKSAGKPQRPQLQHLHLQVHLAQVLLVQVQFLHHPVHPVHLALPVRQFLLRAVQARLPVVQYLLQVPAHLVVQFLLHPVLFHRQQLANLSKVIGGGVYLRPAPIT